MKIICQLHFGLLAAAVFWFQAMQGDAWAGVGEFQQNFFNYENGSRLQTCFYQKQKIKSNFLQIDTILLC